MSEIQNDGHGSQEPTIIVNQVEHKSNGVGVAGFVLAIIASFLGWIPIFGWILWVVGFILSFVGVFRKPKGLAIAGLIISSVILIVLIIVFSILSEAILEAFDLF
ncbi:MAG: hypothetical protein LBU83_13420 [Bacteroidales bacterium]|jgi:hypothetical protein|nr:hypothetical protein [Bacteroidales bacterium]